MGLIGGIGVSLALIAVPIVVVALIIGAVRRAADEDQPAGEPGIGTVRRLFIYGLAFVALGLGSSGVALLLGGMLDAVVGDRLISASNTELATALSLTVVGLPVWATFLLLAQRSLRQHTAEHRSLARGFYLLFVRAIALVVVIVNAEQSGEMLFGLTDFRGSPWGWLIVGLSVWFLHTQIAARSGTNTARMLDRGYLAFGSVVGLYVLAAGLIMALIEPGTAAYDALFRSELARALDWSDGLIRAGILAGIGGVVWGWHWIVRLRPSAPTLPWHIVIFLFGILAGVAAAIGAGAVALHTLLAWALGVSTASDAPQHFSGMVPALAFALIGGGSWLYHHAVLRDRISADAAPSDPARINRYLLAAAGLVALSSGVTAGVALAIDGLIPVSDLVRPGDWWRDQLATTLTLVVVGGPLWWLSWTAAQRAVETFGAEERAALPRRALIFIVFAAAMLLSLGNLAVLLFHMFEATLASDFNRETIREVRWSVAMLVTAGVVAGYYWFILREDQSELGDDEVRVPDDTPRRVRTVTIVGPAIPLEAAAARLQSLGIAVRRIRRLDLEPATSPPSFERELDGLAEILQNFRAPEALILIGADGIDVTPVASDAGTSGTAGTQ